MSKKRDYERIAKRAGIIRPAVQYKRKMGYIVSIADVPMTDRKGYTQLEVGLYASLDDAREQLPDDIQACVDRHLSDYPGILERVEKRYQPGTLSDRDTTYTLLKSLLQADNPTMARSAQTAIDYLQALESQLADTTHPKGTYTSQYPEQNKKPIAWEQPDYREHPVYTFTVDCPYCGDNVTLERHSPRQPAHCGKTQCATAHNRVLARERKRRQRQREKKSQE